MPSNTAKSGRKPTGLETAILQALRAGPMGSDEIWERWTGCSHALGKLVRAGLIRCEGKRYEITELGRRECPLRNPAAAKPRTLPRMAEQVRGPSTQQPDYRKLGYLESSITP
jgi:hypothetical protein